MKTCNGCGTKRKDNKSIILAGAAGVVIGIALEWLFHI